MAEIHEITDNEKKLLNTLGRIPDIPLRDLANYTKYKRMSSIVRKMAELREQYILLGPFYFTEWSKLSKNPLHRIYCTVETRLNYTPVITYLSVVESLIWVYPVLSSSKNVLNVEFLSSNKSEIASIFYLLKNNGIISDYIIRVSRHKKVKENPNLYGEHNPSLDNLLAPCELPDLSLGYYDTYWSECDIAILPYLLLGFKGAKLIEILRAEKRVNRTWSYEQIKYSRKKMIENGLIKKEYVKREGFCTTLLEKNEYTRSILSVTVGV